MTASPPTSRRLFTMVWKLLRLRLLISINSFRHAKTSRKVVTVIAMLGLLAFIAVIFVLSWTLLSFLRSPELGEIIALDPAPFLEMVPVLILTSLFLGILLTSFGVLLQALYLSGDMDFLLSSPMPIRAVFIAKLLQAILPNFGLISLFGLPVLFGLGISAGYNFLYYPFVVLVMVVLALAAAGISALLVMLVVRVLPPRRAAEILGFLGATLGLVCSQIGNFTQSFNENANITGEQVTGIASTLVSINTPWMPLNWAGQGLVAIGEARWLSGLLLVGLTLVLSALAFVVALNTAERWYYSGWAGMQVVAHKKKPDRMTRRHSVARSERLHPLARLLPNPVRGILVKDFLVLRRDLRNLSQLISPLILGVIYSLMIFRTGGEPPPGQGEAPAWFMESFRVVLTYGSVGMSLFVGWMLLGRLAGMGFSQEGKNFWILKASPARPRHLLAAKFLVAYLPALALGWLFLVGLSIVQRLPLGDFLYSLLAVALCLAGMTGILLAFGVAGANLTWEDPRKMTAGGMGCLGQLLTMLYLPIAFGLFIGPVWAVVAFKLPVALGYLGGLLLGGGTCLAGAILPLSLARRKLERLGEA